MINKAREIVTYFFGEAERDITKITTETGTAQDLILAGCLMIFDLQPEDDVRRFFQRCFRLYHEEIDQIKIEENWKEIDRRIALKITGEKHCINSTLAQVIVKEASDLLSAVKSKSDVEPVAEYLYKRYFYEDGDAEGLSFAESDHEDDLGHW